MKSAIRAVTRDLALLRQGPARRLTAAELTSALGDGMVLAALPFAVIAAGGSQADLAAALSVQAAAMVLAFLPAGILGDRLDRRAVIIAGDLLRCACSDRAAPGGR